jgi:DNA-binding CsgD family transcriptional regulator
VLNCSLPFFLGMAFLEAWVSLLYSSTVLLLPPANLIPLSITHLFSTIAVAATSLVIALIATRVSPLSHHRRILYTLGCVGALATTGIACASAGILAPEWVMVCVFLTALSGSFLALAWVENLVTQGVRGAIVCFALAAIMGSFLSLLIALLPQGIGIACTVLLPLLAIASLRPFDSPLLTTPWENHRESPPRALSLLGEIPWQFILVVGIVNFSFGAINTFYLPARPDASLFSEWSMTLVAITLAFLIASVIAFYSFRINTAIAFYIAIPFVAFASLLLVVPVSFPKTFLLPTISVGVGLIRLLVWLLLVKAVLDKRAPAAFCFGFLAFAQFSGTFLGQIIAVASGNNQFILSFAILICLLIAALIVVAARGLLSPVHPERPELTDKQQALNVLGERHGLSPREKEVLVIWLSGHTSNYVEESLHISKNTVKTHLSHIYAKTGTSNREELLALVEGNTE